MNALRKILQSIDLVNKHWGILQRRDSIVVGVSGGPDSSALLAALSKFKKRYALRLFAAHLDHALSKRHRLRFRRAAERLCRDLGVPLHLKTVFVRQRARKTGRSIEEAGRFERYRFFEDVAHRVKANKIATAHTLDDQAETVLMRLLRGAGLKGLAGIPFKRKQGSYTLIRPLLYCRKSDILRFLKESRIRYAVDPSNRNLFFTRNRVRSLLLPLLEDKFNPDVKRGLANLQIVCQQVADFLEVEAARALRLCLQKARHTRTVRLRMDRLRRLHPALLQEVLIKAVEMAKGDSRKVGFAHIFAIRQLLERPGRNLELHMPGVQVKKSRESLILKKRPIH